MSTNVKGIAELELKADRFKRPAQDVNKTFGELEQKGKQSMQGLGASADRTKTTFTQFSQEGRRAFDQISQGADRSKSAVTSMGSAAGPSLTNATQNMNKLGVQSQQTAVELNASKTAMLGLVTSVASLATSFVALETTFTNIPKRLKAISQAEVGLERAQNLRTTKLLALEKVELRINKFREKGMGQSAEIQIALKDQARLTAELGTAEADLAVKTEDLNLKHADYADTLKLMASSIFTTFLTAGTSVTIMLSSMATQAKMTVGEFVKLKLSTIAQSRALNFLKIDLVNARANFLGYSSAAAMSSKAGIVAATGIRRVGLAFKGLFVAMGPIGWAIIGITALWEAWNSNLFGFRNIMHDVTKFLADVFKPVLETIAGIVGFFTGETVELTNAWEDFNNIVFPPLYDELQEAEGATEELTEDVNALTAAAEAETLALGDMGMAMGAVGGMTSKLGSDIGATANSILKLQTVHNEFWTKQVGEFDKTNELLQGYLHTATGGFEEQLDHFARAMIMNIHELEKEAGDLTDAFGKKAVDQWVKDWEPWIQQQVELFGPEATRKKIDSFTQIDKAHRESIKGRIQDNDAWIASNEAVGVSIDNVKKKRSDVNRGLIEDAETIDQFMDMVMQKTNEARNEVLGIGDRNIWGDDLIKQATATGVTDFGSSSAFVNSAAFQAENLRRIAHINRNRQHIRDRRFASGSPSGSRTQYGGTSSFAGRTLTRAKGSKGKKYRPPDKRKFLADLGFSLGSSDLISQRFNREILGSTYAKYTLYGRQIHDARYRAFGPNHAKLSRIYREFTDWWAKEQVRLAEKREQLQDYRALRAVPELDYGYIDVFYKGIIKSKMVTNEEGQQIIGYDYGPIFLGRRYGVSNATNRLYFQGRNDSGYRAHRAYESALRFLNTRDPERQHGVDRRSTKEIMDELSRFRTDVTEKTDLTIDQQYNIDINPLRQRQELHNRLMYEDRILMEAVST